MSDVNKQLLDALGKISRMTMSMYTSSGEAMSEAKHIARQAIASADQAQQADNQSEEAAYIKWMCETFPAVYDPPLARLWIEQKHVSFLAWMERAKQPPAVAVPQEAADSIRSPFNACCNKEHCRAMLASAKNP